MYKHIYIYIVIIYPPPCRQAAGRVFIESSGLLYFWIGIPEGTLAPPCRVDRIPLRSHFRLLAPILPLMLAILPVLLAILAPTCSTSARKMPEKCHLGANIAKKVLQPPLQAPPNTEKLLFSSSFCTFSAIQPMCQNSPKMLPTCSQNLPS